MRVILESNRNVSPRVISLKNFGAFPNSGADMGIIVRSAIDAAHEVSGPVVLEFEKGRYDFYSKSSIKIPFHITNTTSEKENPDITKIMGIYLNGMKDVALDGNGSLFVFHGKMITFMVDQSENVELRNLSIDFERPTVSEMTVDSIGEDHIDFIVNHDSWYEINNGKLIWVGEGFRYTGGPSQECDPSANKVWRTWNPAFEAKSVIELEPYKLRFYYDTVVATKRGNVFQMRDGIREQVGALIRNSKNVAMKNLGFHFTHGLGIVGQCSENLHFENIDFSPRSSTGRTTAGFADFVHMSGCKGLITVLNSRFVGAQDDAINVHGTHLIIQKICSENELVVRFMHPQSYGIDAFFPGDNVDFVDSTSLTVEGNSCVQTVEKLSDREIKLVFDQKILECMSVGDAVENATWTPEVVMRGNYFAQIPTRGILVSTRREVLVEDNIFERIQMSGILISDDARTWFESGMAKDVTIRNNVFKECCDPVISITPENEETDPEKPVHSNILIEGNQFILDGPMVLFAKSTKGLRFINNKITAGHDKTGFPINPVAELLACSDIDISNNVINGERLSTLLVIKKHCI